MNKEEKIKLKSEGKFVPAEAKKRSKVRTIDEKLAAVANETNDFNQNMTGKDKSYVRLMAEHSIQKIIRIMKDEEDIIESSR